MTYLRLLEAEGVDWNKAVQIVVRPAGEPGRARRVWESRLARPHWMTEHGYWQPGTGR
jgi:hypothetical protein